MGRYSRASTYLACFLGFGLVSLAWSWPLPLHLSTHLTGSPSGDTGIYVWNTWVFRHELLERGRFPLFTETIFSLTPQVDLALHNYTAFANLIALPLQSVFSTVTSFNLVYLLLVTLNAAALFALAHHLTGRVAESWLAGALFACTPFLVARGTAHFSLVAAAPLPIFVLLLLRWSSAQKAGRCALLAGATLAWAAFCDAYYGVYCVMLAVIYFGAQILTVYRAAPEVGTSPRTIRALDGLILLLAAVVAVVLMNGGTSTTLWGLGIRVRSLYTPVLLLTMVVLARTIVGGKWRLSVEPFSWPALATRHLVGAASVIVVLLSPVLYGVGMRLVEGRIVSPPVYWRSSAPGVDALAYVVPNPEHALAPVSWQAWLASLPNNYVENVASLSWVALLVIGVAAVTCRWRPPTYLALVTGIFFTMSLGPFVRVAGMNTYVPTPWTFLRYVPVIGEARSPTRLAVVVALGVAVFFALALTTLTRRYERQRRLILTIVGVLLAIELIPIPRPLYSAEIPALYRTIAEDPRPGRVLELPFGLRDGVSSLGNFSANSQFYQTAHGKRLIGGYISRVSAIRKETYRSLPVLNAFLILSENQRLDEQTQARARDAAARFLERAGRLYVVVDRDRTSEDLHRFAVDLLDLEKVQEDGRRILYMPHPTN